MKNIQFLLEVLDIFLKVKKKLDFTTIVTIKYIITGQEKLSKIKLQF